MFDAKKYYFVFSEVLHCDTYFRYFSAILNVLLIFAGLFGALLLCLEYTFIVTAYYLPIPNLAT